MEPKEVFEQFAKTGMSPEANRVIYRLLDMLRSYSIEELSQCNDDGLLKQLAKAFKGK
jgi:hypothetical protein